MLIDARSLENGTKIETDLAIVGAGAAGITIARELAGREIAVTVLESGGLEAEQATQDLYAGEVTGLPYHALNATRLRYLGGSTNHWAGGCGPLDPIDFEQRDWVPYSGWPFGREVLDPYYVRAHEVCELGPFEYDPARWETTATPRLPPGERIVPKMFQQSGPTRFGSVYRHDLERAANVRLYHHANVVEIVPAESERRVHHLRVACLEGPTFEVVARAFVLATGGIENARLLLLSNRVRPHGLGNDHDLVGRFFMDHFGFEGALFVPSDPYVPFDLYRKFPMRAGGPPMRGTWSVSESALRQERILSVASWFLPVWSDAVNRVRAVREGQGRGLRDFVRRLGRVIADLDDTAPTAYRRWRHGRFPVSHFRLDGQHEQAPNPESRVLLSDATDALGCRRVQLQWRLTDLERRSVIRAHELLGQDLGRTGLGRVRLMLEDSGNGWPSSLGGGHHHSGTTRMNADPRQGVVDADCRVHGLGNLFIAGSSVFPTIGCVHPTLTIVALAVRLARHLQRELHA